MRRTRTFVVVAMVFDDGTSFRMVTWRDDPLPRMMAWFLLDVCAVVVVVVIPMEKTTWWRGLYSPNYYYCHFHHGHGLVWYLR